MRHELAALRAGRGGSLVRIVARVDGTGRIAQLEASLPGSTLGTVQIVLWKFGGPIPLSLPLASETAEIGDSARTAPRRPRGSPRQLDEPDLTDQAGRELTVAERGDVE